MRHQGEQVGYFFVGDKANGEAFTAEDEEILVRSPLRRPPRSRTGRTHCEVERARTGEAPWGDPIGTPDNPSPRLRPRPPERALGRSGRTDPGPAGKDRRTPAGRTPSPFSPKSGSRGEPAWVLCHSI